MKVQTKMVKSFYIAGFTYYEGALAFQHLHIGTKLKLVAEPKNRHDDYAVALYFNQFKLGYIPARQNRTIAMLLNNGYNVFKAVVQQIDPHEHPEQQVRVAVFVKPA